MRTDWLSVALVEELHRAIIRGKDIAAVIAGLQGATLSGLLEYGCLRWSRRDDLPAALPERVISSDLGNALHAVRSDLGLRSDGPPKHALRRLDPLPVEFHVVYGANDVLSDEWNHFAGRFDTSARKAGFSFDAAARLQSALYEMTENAVIHSEAQAILAGYFATPGNALFCVVDTGIGVLASLRKNPAYGKIKWHDQAIKTALQDGVSSCQPGDGGGGFGFRKVFQSLRDQWGTLRFRSGEGCVTMDGTGLDADLGSVYHPPPLPGFQVTVCCRQRVSSSNDQEFPLI